jgi:fucose 4-O-acetylase-like acetyltransferase
MRDIALDNFKFILIGLVVVGHTIEPLIDKFGWLKSVYVFIYIFHIPMFAYISGVVSSNKIDKLAIRNIIIKLVIPYVLLEIIYSVFDFYAFSRNSLNISPLVPYWILWYLFSLILWRMLLPIFSNFRFPITLSIIAGLACGVTSYGYNLSFSRTFVFFPFFLFGHYYHSLIMEHFQKYKVSREVGIGIIVTILLVLLFLPQTNFFSVGWLYGSKSYSSLGVGWEQGVLYRFLIYLLAILLGLAFLSVTKKDRNISTGYGERSLYIYVLHGFVMKGLIVVGFYKYIDSGWKAIILILLYLIILQILSSVFSSLFAYNFINPLVFANSMLSKKRL